MEYTPLLLLAYVSVSWCDVLSFMLLHSHAVNVQLLHQSKKEQKFIMLQTLYFVFTFIPVELESLVLRKYNSKVTSCYKNVELHNTRNYVVTYLSDL